MAHELELKVASETLIYCTAARFLTKDWKQMADEDRNSSNGRDRERKETWSDITISIAR